MEILLGIVGLLGMFLAGCVSQIVWTWWSSEIVIDDDALDLLQSKLKEGK
jgi:hypothetical protein